MNRLSGLDLPDHHFRSTLSSPGPPQTSDVSVAPRFFDATGAPRRPVKRKLELPSDLSQIIPESDLFNQLLAYERRIDNLIEERNIEVADMLHRNDKAKSVLRVYIWNESHLETCPAKDAPSSFWKLKISGRMLPMNQRPGEVTNDVTETDAHRRRLAFGYFIKSLEVEIDPQNHNGQSTKIRWIKSNKEDEEKDVFEVLRPGEKALPIKISILFDHQAPVFRLGQHFSKLMGFELGTRSKIITELWNYIKTKKLQSNKDPSLINCDSELKEIFGGEDSMPLSTIAGKLNELLTPADKVTLDYTLQLDGYSPAVYDVELEIPSVALSDLPMEFLQRPNQDPEVAKLNQVVREGMAKLMEHKRRRTFYLGFSQNPVAFINSAIKHQCKEVCLLLCWAFIDLFAG